MSIRLPLGYRAAGVYSGVKRNTSRLDLSLVVSDRPAVAAGVYTKNLVCAAPVKLDRERTPSESIRIVAINSGVANACTGDQGDADRGRQRHQRPLQHVAVDARDREPVRGGAGQREGHGGGTGISRRRPTRASGAR